MDITIDKWRKDDLAAMLNIWNEVVEAGMAFPQEVPETLESGKKFFASQDFCAVAKDEAGTVLGLYILHPNNVGRCSQIANASYAVAAWARRRGIGEKLVVHSLKTAANLNFRIMQFNAVTRDNPANKLYLRLGFQPLGTVPGGFRRKDGSFEDINLYYFKL